MIFPVTIKRDSIFYSAMLTVWVLILFALYGTYKYTGIPQSSLAVGDGLVHQKEIIATSINELKSALIKEKDPRTYDHIEHNLGVAYYDMYRTVTDRKDLDSARMFFEAAIVNKPPIARFYYNLGRVYTELRNHEKAKNYYEQTLAVNPAHILALHNLALLNYFELNNIPDAKRYFEAAIALNPRLPLTNYMLGEIAQDQKRYTDAVRYYEQETGIDSTVGYKASALPVSLENIRYARTMAHQRLALIYSVSLVDQKKAQLNLHRYLYLERDTLNRNRTLAEIRKYWVTK